MPCILSISTPTAIAAYSGAVLYKDVNSKEKEISCQALSDPLGCKPHILFIGLCNCFGNDTLPLAQPVLKDANSKTYLKLRMPKQWSAILGGKAMESVLIHHHCSARAYHAMASLVLCRVGRPCSVMIQCTWALIMLLYCTRDLPCVSCSVGYENGKQWKLSEAHCSRNLLEILPFFKLTLRHKQQLILFLISENIFKRCVL